jgi:catechol 2,3-dioxygenase-like lactoylglutathione lyase family enzyme
MALEIVEINHVNITVPEAAEETTKQFYKNILGLEEIPKPDNLKKRGGAWFRQGALEIHLSVEDTASDNAASRRHVCYLVADIAKAEQSFRVAGIEVIPDRRPVEGWLRFYVHDPGGNRLEIAQRELGS